MTTVVIMQPTFLPWLGYFAMIEAAEHFVFLDDVQFSKQSWQSRNRILAPSGEAQLVSLSIARKPSKPLIHEARLAETGFETALLQTVRQSYAKTPHGGLAADLLEDSFAAAKGNLGTLNACFIKSFADLIGIKAQFHHSSQMGVTGGGRSDRLLNLTQALGGETYLSPVGSLGYLAGDNPFEASPVDLRFLNFTHPEYPQGRHPFVSHLAAIDALAHLGPDAVRPMLIDGLGEALTLTALEGHTDERI